MWQTPQLGTRHGSGLGGDFLREIVKVWDRIEFDPWTGAMGGLRSPVRWLYPDRFPYKVIYKIDAAGKAILVIAVLHAARHSRIGRRAASAKPAAFYQGAITSSAACSSRDG
jgi:hypothetical protein